MSKIQNSTRRSVTVIGAKDMATEGALRLNVSSRALLFNPAGWKDLWLLSPFSAVQGGVAVPGLPGLRSQTVENVWQFLKVWDEEEDWCEEDALEAFRSTCAIRFPRGRGATAIGHWWGEKQRVIDYVEARWRIYIPCYLEMLAQPDRQSLVDRIRKASEESPVDLWDFDSYDLVRHGFSSVAEAVAFTGKPFSHAFLVAAAVNGRVNELISATPESRW